MSVCETRLEQAYEDRPLSEDAQFDHVLDTQAAAYGGDDLMNDAHDVADELNKLLAVGKFAEAGELLGKIRFNTIERSAQRQFYGQCLTPVFSLEAAFFPNLKASLNALTIVSKGVTA